MRILLFGTFDYLHPGHRYVLEQSVKRSLTGGPTPEVYVVVARDSTVEKIKGRAPRQSEADRKAAVEQAFPAVHVLFGDLDDYLAPVRAVRPDLILLGYDQKLPPGISEADLQVTAERLPAYEPHKYKSSLRGTEA